LSQNPTAFKPRPFPGTGARAVAEGKRAPIIRKKQEKDAA